MKVRFTKEPGRRSIQGISLSCYHVGCTYDIPATLATYLILEGFAEVEMRRTDNRRPVATERRKRFRNP